MADIQRRRTAHAKDRYQNRIGCRPRLRNTTNLGRPLTRPLWHDSVSGHAVNRGCLDRDSQFDIAIIGGGFSGLWTAYYLKMFAPDSRIAVFEKHQIGFGASSRNGGWCSGFLPTSLREFEKSDGRDAAIAIYRNGFQTLDEIERIITEFNIDCDYHRGGTICGATNSVQKSRIEAELDQFGEFGFGDEFYRKLSKHEFETKISLENVLAATYTPYCAALQPTKLVQGLARVVEDLGVKIFENTHVSEYASRRLYANRFRCSVDVIVRATEGFTARLKHHRRTLAPLYSYMVATAPLSENQIAKLGWSNRETYHDARNMIIYAQLTKDRRIAFGGRGAPYHFASRIKPVYDTHEAIHDKIIESMKTVFSLDEDVEVTHRWGGPLGVPRNWRPSVLFDRFSGLAALGGYVGDGVAASNLAARTLAHMIVDDDHPLTKLPWVNCQSKKWEVEPFRFIGINGLLKLSEAIDRHEAKTNQPDRMRSYILDKFLGE